MSSLPGAHPSGPRSYDVRAPTSPRSGRACASRSRRAARRSSSAPASAMSRRGSRASRLTTRHHPRSRRTASCRRSRCSRPRRRSCRARSQGLRLEVLHGRMAADAKEEVMRRFTSGQTQVLVSTTVIEVGVDVPNATVMVVLDADRFGISQLHQLRGRIGRGEHPGRCVLVADVAPRVAVAPAAAGGRGHRRRLRALAARPAGAARGRRPRRRPVRWPQLAEVPQARRPRHHHDLARLGHRASSRRTPT